MVIGLGVCLMDHGVIRWIRLVVVWFVLGLFGLFV
jgi:hypothetical protein